MKANHVDAINVLSRLTSTGHEAYLAGGCVRDLILGHEPNDFDITTSATPEEVQSIFPKTVPVGASFGVVKVICGENKELDVATFRTDGTYLDGRRPDTVSYTKSAEEDVKRRDFTINGMLMDGNGKVIDYVNGKQDLTNRVIRCIGVPAARFGEDALRIMRAVRFSVRLKFDIEQATEDAIRQFVPSLDNISKERITEELTKIFACGRGDEAFWLLNKLGIWDEIFGYVPNGDDKWEAMYGLRKMRPEDSFVLAIALIFGQTYPSSRKQALEKLVLTNEQRRALESLFTRAPQMIGFLHTDLPTQRTIMQWEDKELVLQYLRYNSKIRACRWSLHANETIDQVFARMKEVVDMGWPAPLVTGEDLIGWGWQPGSIFTKMLARIREEQLNGRLTNADEVKAFLLKDFPAAPHRGFDGRIIDGMRRRRMVAQCKRCGRPMSFTMTRDAAGFPEWGSVDDEVGVRGVNKFNTFADCENCHTRRKKSHFVQAVE